MEGILRRISDRQEGRFDPDSRQCRVTTDEADMVGFAWETTVIVTVLPPMGRLAGAV